MMAVDDARRADKAGGTGRSDRAATTIIVVYFAMAAVGLVGTWYFNLSFDPEAAGASYLEAWFANPASSSAAVDVIVAALVACLFYVREGLRLGWRWAFILIPLTFLVALAFTFPLFLGLREMALRRTSFPAGARESSVGASSR